ncbi:hypothetical protein, partial [Parabacteroides sp.]
AAVAGSATAMAAVAGSATAMAAVAGSATAMAAVAGSATAMAAIMENDAAQEVFWNVQYSFGRGLATYANINNSTLIGLQSLSAVAASAVAMSAVAASAVAMSAVAASAVAMSAVAASAVAMSAVAASAVAMSAVAGSKAAVSALNASPLVKKTTKSGSGWSNGVTVVSGKAIILATYCNNSDNALGHFKFDGTYDFTDQQTSGQYRLISVYPNEYSVLEKITSKASIKSSFIIDWYYDGSYVKYIPIN